VLTRREAAVLSVRLLARRVDLMPPADVEAVEVDLSVVDGDLDDHELVVRRPDRAMVMSAARTVVIEAPGDRLQLELRPRRRLDHRSVPAARLTPWPVLRRAMAETRDRLRPLVRSAAR